MSKLPFILVAVFIGAVLTIQPGLNADVARRVGSPVFATLISIFVSFVTATAVVAAIRPPVSWSGVATMPWHLWLAGTVGVIFVGGALWLAPKLGAALLFVSVVAGQMIAATFADIFGFAGYQAEGVQPMRLVGIALVLAGVWVFQRAT